MPFFETATLGSPGAPVLPDGDVINHFNGIRIRVTGSGILRGTIYSMDHDRDRTLPTISMPNNTSIVEYIKTNFMQQRASVRFETTAIDEVFQINRITIYSKPVFTMYPG